MRILRTAASTALALLLIAPQAEAQGTGTGLFQTGTTYLGPRVWIGNLNGAMAIGGQAERGFTQPGANGPGIIAGGVGIDWYSWSHNYGFGEYSYSVIPIQVFGNYHFKIEGNEKLDPYVGLAFVYSIVSASWSGTGVAAGAESSSFTFAGQGGVRYFLSEKFALQGQVGFGYGTLGLGVTWRM